MEIRNKIGDRSNTEVPNNVIQKSLSWYADAHKQEFLCITNETTIDGWDVNVEFFSTIDDQITFSDGTDTVTSTISTVKNKADFR